MVGPSLPALPKDAYTPWISRVAAVVIDVVPLVVLMLVAKANMSIAERCLFDENARDISYCRWPSATGSGTGAIGKAGRGRASASRCSSSRSSANVPGNQSVSRARCVCRYPAPAGGQAYASCKLMGCWACAELGSLHTPGFDVAVTVPARLAGSNEYNRSAGPVLPSGHVHPFETSRRSEVQGPPATLLIAPTHPLEVDTVPPHVRSALHCVVMFHVVVVAPSTKV